MRKVEGTATISIEELDRLREREQWYNDLRGKLKNIVGKLDTEEYDKEMKKIDDSPDDISDEELDALIKQAAGTVKIILNGEIMGEWRPRYVIWENVKNVKSKYMRPNFDRYMDEMEKLGYTNNYAVLDAREFGLPQARERVFTVSVLNGEKFEFDDLIRTPMRNLQEFLEDDVPDIYDVTQPSVLACIGEKGIRRATVIKDCAYTITTRQDRTPAQVIDRGDGRYRYLTERECWRLMGYSDEDFDRAKAVQERNGKYYKALYDQAGNSIAVPIFESIFRKIILQEVA